MAASTRFTSLVGCDLPLQLAAMGGVGTEELASAVAAAGGLGMVRDKPFEPDVGACGTSFLVPYVRSLDQVAAAATGSPLVELFYGDPAGDLVDAVHREGALAGWQVGSAAEARAAEDCGCDYVVAQGTEAGGHVRGTQPLEEVLLETLAAVRVPVVAAGGIATAERVAEVLALGADAVRVGTRFLACPESGAHPEYVAALLRADGEEATVLTEWFGEGWEDAPHRVLRPALEAARRSGWRSPRPPGRGSERDAADMAMYAGAGVGHVTAVEPAAAVVADLVARL